MSTRPKTESEFPSRASHIVETPEHYGTWREYAFSSAPELVDAVARDTTTDASALTPAEDTTSV